MVAAVDVCIDGGGLDAAAQFFGGEEIVDAPAGVCEAGFAQVRPPGVGAGGIGVEGAVGVEEAGGEEFLEFAALFVGEAGVVVVRLRVFEVDVLMRDVEVAAEKNGLFDINRLQICTEYILPCQPIIEAFEPTLTVWRIAVDEIEIRKLQGNDTTLAVILRIVNAIYNIQRFETGKYSRTRVTFLFSTIPVLLVPWQIEDGLSLLHLCLLHAENISIQHTKDIHKALLQTSAQAVDIPRNKLVLFHLSPPSPSCFSSA